MPIKDIQTTNKQHAVPQNIMDVEFKIIGDLTMRQFAYLMGFGGLAFVGFSYVGGIFRIPLALGSVLLGLGFAFIPIEDRGMDQWVVNFFKAVYAPTQKVWKKDANVPSVFMYQNMALVRQELITLAPTTSRRKLEEYLETQVQSSEEDRLDIPEAEFTRKVHDAFASTTTAGQNQYGYTGVYTGGYTAQPAVDISTITPLTPQDFKPISEEGKKPEEPTAPSISLPQLGEAPQMEPSVPSAPMGQEPPQVQVSATSTITPASQQQAQPQPNKYNIKPARKKQEEPTFKLPTKVDHDMVFSSVSSGATHAGRKFLNLTNIRGEIVLPIRGEKKLKTSEEIDIEEDIQQKTSQLNDLISKIKHEEGIKETRPSELSPSTGGGSSPFAPVPGLAAASIMPASPVKPTPSEDDEDFDIEANQIIEKVKTENTRLTDEISKLRGEIETSKEKQPDGSAVVQKQEELKHLQEDKSKSDTNFVALQKQLQELQERLKQKEQISPTMGAGVSPVQPSYAKNQPLSTKPNVISGIVRNPQGLALEGIVLILKNLKGDAVRATKTNSLGQFSLVTPLSNGMYTVEVGPYNKVGLSFDIISVEAKGDIIPPLEFTGKQ